MDGELPGPAPTDPARSTGERPAVTGAVATEEVRTRRLVVVDEVGEERIVATVDRGQATLQVLVAGCPDGEETMVDISAGDDPEFGPSIGVHLCARGDEVAVFTVWRDDATPWREGAGPWRAAVSGPAIDARLDEAG
ncbi:MAG: hypothetical protein ACRDZR_07955 [Acidimicrobiales bacterium]